MRSVKIVLPSITSTTTCYRLESVATVEKLGKYASALPHPLRDVLWVVDNSEDGW